MADKDPGLESALRELSGGISSILQQQRALAEKMGALEARIRRIEGGEPPADSALSGEKPRHNVYDYRVLFNSRTYAIADVGGREARMEGVRRCLALRKLSRIRTRYHTGSGAREAAYSYRVIEEAQSRAPDWTPLEYRILEGAGADFSASLPLPVPIRNGEVFEVRHELALRDVFTTRNEWVTLVVEYPTEAFRLEVLLPAGRKIVGARREESQGASNSFNKRRMYPRILSETGQTCLEWEERQPVTGRAYTLFWDW